MRLGTCAAPVCVWVLLATPVAAQSTTEDGIRAVLRGDYQTAYRILRPLANDAAQPDPVAQFFLAILYHSGQGVGPDLIRACNLFLRAAARAHPFSEQSAAIAAHVQDLIGDGAWICGGDEPQSFLLGPGHRVEFTETSITVTYGGQEQRTIHLLPRGAVPLPIQHRPLFVTRPIAMRRDFFQWFYWMPDRPAKSATWTLRWILIEIAGNTGIGLASEESLVTANGRTPPTSFDVSTLVRLQVNAQGEAEFTITGGTSPRSEVIRWQEKR